MDKVMKVIKEIIAKGITKIKEIIEEIKKHFFPSLEGGLFNSVTFWRFHTLETTSFSI